MRKLLLIATLLAVSAFWALATIEVQTTTPLVNCDGKWQVGQLRLIFSEAEFTSGDPRCQTDFYTLIRVQLTGVHIASIGTVTDYTLWVPAELVIEADAGAGFLPFGSNITPLSAFLFKWFPGNAQRGRSSRFA